MYLPFFIAGFLAGCGCCWLVVSAWIESLRQELKENGFNISDEPLEERQGLAY
jgi:hypothetical protein